MDKVRVKYLHGDECAEALRIKEKIRGLLRESKVPAHTGVGILMHLALYAPMKGDMSRSKWIDYCTLCYDHMKEEMEEQQEVNEW